MMAIGSDCDPEKQREGALLDAIGWPSTGPLSWPRRDTLFCPTHIGIIVSFLKLQKTTPRLEPKHGTEHSEREGK